MRDHQVRVVLVEIGGVARDLRRVHAGVALHGLEADEVHLAHGVGEVRDHAQPGADVRVVERGLPPAPTERDERAGRLDLDAVAGGVQVGLQLRVVGRVWSFQTFSGWA